MGSVEIAVRSLFKDRPRERYSVISRRLLSVRHRPSLSSRTAPSSLRQDRARTVPTRSSSRPKGALVRLAPRDRAEGDGRRRPAIHPASQPARVHFYG